MKISLDELKSHPAQRMALIFKEELEGLSAVKPVVAQLNLTHDASGVHVQGLAQTLLKLNCDRCLRPYFQSLNVDIDERLVYSSGVEPGRDRELLKDDFVESLPVSGVLDITDIVYQAVTLASPNYCLCGEQCPGTPAARSKESSLGSAKESAKVDPRWKNLKTLFPNEETDENS